MTNAPLVSTYRDLVELSLRDSGWLAMGQTAPSQIMNEALQRLNMMLSVWNAKRWLTWHLQDLAVTSTGAIKYAVGPGGDFQFSDPDFNNAFGGDYNATLSSPYNTSNPGPVTYGGIRPPKVEYCYARLTNSPSLPVDYPLKPLLSMEDYKSITLKTMSNYPTHYFYDPAMPQGYVYCWPIPLAAIYTIHILVRQPLRAITSLEAQVAFPPEYIPAMQLNLAVWMRKAAKMPDDPGLIAMARDALNTIRNNNTETANLTMPDQFRRPGIYNILADQFH